MEKLHCIHYRMCNNKVHSSRAARMSMGLNKKGLESKIQDLPGQMHLFDLAMLPSEHRSQEPTKANNDGPCVVDAASQAVPGLLQAIDDGL